MGKVVEAELLLKGTDKTGAAFAGVIKHAEELQAKLRGINYGAGNAALAEQGAEIRKNNSLLRAELALTQTINRAQLAGNTALAERATLFGRMRSHVQGIAAVGGMGWMIGGLASGRLAHAAAKDTGDFAHQRALLGAGGMTPAEVAKAERVAMALRVPLMSAADNIKAIGELRMVFNSTDHAIEHVGALQRAAAMMKAMNPQMDAESESYNLARALEIKGVSSDPAHFNKLTNMMVQAINASHGKITGSEFFEFTKYTRGGANRLSDEFYTRVAPTLIQELGGHSAGMALSSFRQTLVGGKMTNRAAEEFVRLGLIDPKAVIHTKTGSVKGVRPGGLVDSALANENPYAWIQGYLKPALSKAKITDNNKIAEELAHLFGNRFAEQMASILLNQSQRIEKDWGLIAGAPSSEYLEKILAEDPQAAASNMSKAINTLLASLGGPLVQPAIDGMNKVSGWARSFADSYATFATEHPNAAKNASGAAAIGLGYASLKGFRATWGLLSGSTALKGSAAALAQSAVALDAAAVRLGAGGAVGNAVAGGAAAGAARGAGGLAGAVARFPWLFWLGGAYSIATTPDVFDRDKTGRRYFDRLQDMRDPQGLEHILPGSLKPLSRLSMMDLQAGRPWEQVSGSAEVVTTVKVEASPDFLTRIEQKINNAIHGLVVTGAPPTGTSGSIGGSMPEALPGGIRNHW